MAVLIADRIIGRSYEPLVIVEPSGNHSGSLEHVRSRLSMRPCESGPTP